MIVTLGLTMMYFHLLSLSLSLRGGVGGGGESKCHLI